MAARTQSDRMEQIVTLAKRRGFVFPSSEIYGGIGGFYDYGPLGAALKRNIENVWWKAFVEERDDVVGLESSVIMNPKVWEASGHLESFTDPLIECKICHARFRADLKDEIAAHEHHSFTEPRAFQMMFKTHVGSVEDDASVAFLRPETAQGMFTNFQNVLVASRARVPFGIAQIGRSFRNEITYRNFIFRMREFDIAELEYFVKPGDDERAFDEWLTFMERVLSERFGIATKNLQRYEHPKQTLAHYSKRTVDIQYHYPWGWDELWGIANRTDYDLAQHEKASGKSMQYRDPVSSETFRPYVIEPTGGIDRLFLAILCESYETVAGGRTTTTESTKEEETVLRMPKHLAPVKIAVLPLSKKEKLSDLARSVAATLRARWTVDYDEVASIGRRYRRQDEIGTPYSVTVDFESLDDQMVTVRDRDTMEQERIHIKELEDYLARKLSS
ncbi:MAG: glycine--tRNA ligase [Candidatus Kerfeldbacteria bacterium]|nr:glycine--tRNA ligase [Candidatus Kerfeldbacteria bacterium]